MASGTQHLCCHHVIKAWSGQQNEGSDADQLLCWPGSQSSRLRMGFAAGKPMPLRVAYQAASRLLYFKLPYLATLRIGSAGFTCREGRPK